MPIEPSAKIAIRPIETFAISPLMCQPFTVQPGPHGMNAKAAMAVKAETSGARMYGRSIADSGANASLRTSLTRSAIGCRRPNLPARFGPKRSCIRPISFRSTSVR